MILEEDNEKEAHDGKFKWERAGKNLVRGLCSSVIALFKSPGMFLGAREWVQHWQLLLQQFYLYLLL